MALHQYADGTFGISSHGIWLPGIYDSPRAARYAFRFPHVTLEYIARERAGRPITFDHLRSYRHRRVEGAYLDAKRMGFRNTIQCCWFTSRVPPGFAVELDLQGTRDLTIDGWVQGVDDAPLAGIACPYPPPYVTWTIDSRE